MKDSKLKTNILLLLVLLLLGLSGCSEEASYEDTTDEQTHITISTRNLANDLQIGTSDESTIQTLRAIVFEVKGSTYIEQIANKLYTNNVEFIKIEYKKCDYVRVLLIANERNEWDLGDKQLSAEQIKNIAVSYGSSKEVVDIKTPIIMFGESEEALTGRTPTSTTIQLVRNLARVDLNISCDFQAISSQLANGKLTLKTARIERMAATTGLEKMINVDINDNFLTGKELKFDESNFLITESGFTTIGNGADNSVTFYIPEYNIKDVKAYSYIYITGEFTPKNSVEAIKVAYTIPIGGNITTDKILGNENFTISDLLVERNFLYKMKAKITSIQQINEINVDVLPWTDKNINGDIETPKPAKLNISNLYPIVDVAGNEKTLVQFWSDQPQESIRVLQQGTIKSTTETFKVNDIFVDLADSDGLRASQLTFEPETQWGRLSLTFIPRKAVTGETYVITLAAGTLRRTIEVTAIKETETLNESQQSTNN